jgi:hypothetical protein
MRTIERRAVPAFVANASRAESPPPKGVDNAIVELLFRADNDASLVGQCGPVNHG